MTTCSACTIQLVQLQHIENRYLYAHICNNHNQNKHLKSLRMKKMHPICSTQCSLFDSQLTPYRAELLISGYCNISNYSKIPTDVMILVILFFDQIMYLQCTKITYNMLQDDDLSAFKLQQIMNPSIQRTYIFINKIGFKFIFSLATYTPLTTVIEVNLKLNVITKWNLIKYVIFRVRVFCLSTKHEQELLIISTSKETISICKLLDGLSTIIGLEIELLHVLFNNDTYWTKWSYPWTNNVDRKYAIRDKWYFNYFNKRCFGVNDQFYMYIDDDINKFSFDKFEMIRKLKQDIILIKKDDKSILYELTSNEEMTNKPWFSNLPCKHANYVQIQISSAIHKVTVFNSWRYKLICKKIETHQLSETDVEFLFVNIINYDFIYQFFVWENQFCHTHSCNESQPIETFEYDECVRNDTNSLNKKRTTSKRTKWVKNSIKLNQKCKNKRRKYHYHRW